MPVQYEIAAEVADITSDSPRPDDNFLVDSNIWFWMAYTNASHGVEPWRWPLISLYPRYVNDALAVGARLGRCGLALAELAHLIEMTERKIFDASIGTKVFRHNHPVERAVVVAEIQAAWGQVKTLACALDLSIDEETTAGALNRFQSQRVDGYDLFLLELMARSNLGQIITDDGDFATVPGIRVFTANPNVLKAARSQGKIITR
jgi:predicted nucleic acid-binding protein